MGSSLSSWRCQPVRNVIAALLLVLAMAIPVAAQDQPDSVLASAISSAFDDIVYEHGQPITSAESKPLAQVLHDLATRRRDTPTTPGFRTLLTVSAMSALPEMQLTEACLYARVCREINFFMFKGVGPAHTVGRAVIKGAGAAFVTRTSLHLWRHDHKWQAVTLASGYLGMNIYLSQRSYKILHDMDNRR